MDPKIWGPHAWVFLHCITFAYPENPTAKDKEIMKSFLGALPGVLPCMKCRNNCKNHYKKLPLTDEVLASRASLTKWLIDIHNSVNVMNNKPIKDPITAINEYKKMYNLSDNNKNKKNNNNNKLLLSSCCVVIILIIILIYFM